MLFSMTLLYRRNCCAGAEGGGGGDGMFRRCRERLGVRWDTARPLSLPETRQEAMCLSIAETYLVQYRWFGRWGRSVMVWV